MTTPLFRHLCDSQCKYSPCISHISTIFQGQGAFSCCTSDTDRDLIPKHYDWSKHQYQDDESYIELIAELKFNNRLRDKLNHFGMSVTYFARKFDVAKSFWSIFNAAPHWVNIQHWIDGKFELGHIIPQSIFVPSNIIHGNRPIIQQTSSYS